MSTRGIPVEVSEYWRKLDGRIQKSVRDMLEGCDLWTRKEMKLPQSEAELLLTECILEVMHEEEGRKLWAATPF